MWSIFWEFSWQKGHSADSTYPHLWRLCAVLPRPLFILFASVHCCFDVVWKPGSDSHGYRYIFPTPRGYLRPFISPGVLQVKIWVKTFIKWISWTYTRCVRSSFNYPPGAILWSPKICLYFFSSAAALLICGGAIPLMTGSHAFGIDFRAPEIVLIESFRHVSTLPTWELRFHTGHAYSATL